MEFCDQSVLDLGEDVMPDSLGLALLTLGGWLALSVLLVLPLAVSALFHRRPPRGQAGREPADAASLEARIQREREILFSASAPPRSVPSSSRLLPERLATRQAPRHTAEHASDAGSAPGMQVNALSDGGRIPGAQENEDSFLTVTGARGKADQLRPCGLFVVTDGVSGYATGHEASRRTLLAISQRCVPVLTQPHISAEDLALLLAEAIQSANRELYEHNRRSPQSLGCTVTAALITDQQACICHVGKNRAYLLNELMPLRRVTVDHSIVESLVVAGFIKREEIYTHPQRNRIFRCLGQGPEVEIDTTRVPLSPGDRLLLCSDGLWEALRDPAIEEVLRQHADTAQASSKLVTLAKKQGGLDDITAVLVSLTDAPMPFKRSGISQICSSQVNLTL
jgi:serine/threonine protein phosphatase PrpC